MDPETRPPSVTRSLVERALAALGLTHRLTADRRRRVELEVSQVNPQVPDGILYERQRLHRKHAWIAVLRPSSSRHFSQLDRLLVSQVLGQRDVRMIGKRLLVFQGSHVQGGMHLEQLFAAFLYTEIDYIGNGENHHFAGLDRKVRKIRYPRVDGFDGVLWRALERAWRQNRHVGSGHTTRDQLPAQIVQKFTQRIGDIGDKGKAIHQILPARIAEHSVILTRLE